MGRQLHGLLFSAFQQRATDRTNERTQERVLKRGFVAPSLNRRHSAAAAAAAASKNPNSGS